MQKQQEEEVHRRSAARSTLNRRSFSSIAQFVSSISFLIAASWFNSPFWAW